MDLSWIWIWIRFGLKLIVENMEMTEMAETLVEIDQFPVPRVGPRHSTQYQRVTDGHTDGRTDVQPPAYIYYVLQHS